MYSSGIDGGRMHCWLIILLLCAQLTIQVPLPSEEPAPLPEREASYSPVEDARKFWNDAKKLGRKLTPRIRRSEGVTVETTSATQPESNITAPKYILEVYRNLSKRPEPTEANTIRSLQTVVKGKTVSR